MERRTRRHSRAAIAFAAALLALVAPPGPASATSGSLDDSFSGNGWVRTLEVRTPNNVFHPRGAEDIAVQPDGRIVAVGELLNANSTWYFGAFRYTPDGRLDQSFGHGGWVATRVGSFPHAHGVAIQDDGKIVVAGETDCEHAMCFVVARYQPDGDLDPTFGGGDGIRRAPSGYRAMRGYDVAIQDNGRIVVVGSRHAGDDGQDTVRFAAMRFLSDGRIDDSFSGDGRVIVDFGYGNDHAEAVAIDEQGRIVMAGVGTHDLYATEDDFAFARLRRDGSLDASFSGDGMKTVHFGASSGDLAHSVALQDNRRILAAGSTYGSGRAGIGVVRLTEGGALDASFGNDGRVRTSPGRHGGYGADVLRHPDGSVIVAGRAFEDSVHDTSDWIVARYRPDGTRDVSFGGDGLVRTDFGTGADQAMAIALHRNGEVVVGGSIYNSLGLARYVVE